MAPEPKTKPETASVDDFLAHVADPLRRTDAQTLAALITRATATQPQMWGASIVGWGTRPVEYAGGRTQDWLRLGLSPRKAELAVYGLSGGDASDPDWNALGKVTSGKGCVWIKKLSGVDLAVLERVILKAWNRD